MHLSRIIVFIFTILFSFSAYTQNKLIAFSSDATKNDKQGIFIMDENGDGVKQVAFSNLDCYNPVFSPDGNKIVFRATDGKSDYLYMIDLKDSASWNFPVFIDGGVDPVFSPEGDVLLYRSEKLQNNAIYVTDLATGESYEVSDGSMSFHAEFDHEGNSIVYSSTAEETPDIVVLDLTDTTDKAQKVVAQSKDAELMGTFSPDDKQIAYASFDVNYKGTVHICNADGSGNRIISRGLGSSYNPKFSPDGNYICFVTVSGNNIELYICKPDGSGLKQISNNSGTTQEYDWSSDSQKIVYEDKMDNISSIKVYNLKTGKTDNLTGSKANNVSPSFQK